MSKRSQSTKATAGELIVRNGPDRGVVRTLLVPITVIGSGKKCDLRILDLEVRKTHCAISVTPEGPHLQCLGGMTPVNGVNSASRLLQTGDVVTVGPVELEVHWFLPPSPTASPFAAQAPKGLKPDSELLVADRAA